MAYGDDLQQELDDEQNRTDNSVGVRQEPHITVTHPNALANQFASEGYGAAPGSAPIPYPQPKPPIPDNQQAQAPDASMSQQPVQLAQQAPQAQAQPTNGMPTAGGPLFNFPSSPQQYPLSPAGQEILRMQLNNLRSTNQLVNRPFQAQPEERAGWSTLITHNPAQANAIIANVGKPQEQFSNQLESGLRSQVALRGQDVNLGKAALQQLRSIDTAGSRAFMNATKDIQNEHELEVFAGRLKQEFDSGQINAYNANTEIMRLKTELLASGQIHANQLANQYKQGQINLQPLQADLTRARTNESQMTAGPRAAALSAAAASSNANTGVTQQNMQPHMPSDQDFLNGQGGDQGQVRYSQGGRVGYADGGDVADQPEQPDQAPPEQPGLLSRVASALNPIGTAEAAAPQQNTQDLALQAKQDAAAPSDAMTRKALNDLERDAILLHMKSAYGPEQNSTFTGNYVPSHEGSPSIGEDIGAVLRTIPTYAAKLLQTDAPESGFNLAARQDMDTKAKTISLSNIKNQVGGRVTNMEIGIAGQGQGFNDQPYANVIDNIDRYRYMLDRGQQAQNEYEQAKRRNPSLDQGAFERAWADRNPIDSHSGRPLPGYTPFPSFDQYKAAQDARRAPQVTPTPETTSLPPGLHGFIGGDLDRASLGLARYALGDNRFNAAREATPNAYSAGQTVGNLTSPVAAAATTLVPAAMQRGIAALRGLFPGGGNPPATPMQGPGPSGPAMPQQPQPPAFGNAINGGLSTTTPEPLPPGTFQGAAGRFQSGAIPLGAAGERPPMSQYARGGWTPQASNLSRRAGGQIRPEALGAKARNPLLQPQTPVVGMPPVNDPIPKPPAPPQFKQQLYGDQPGTPHYGSGGEVINAGYAHGGQVPSYLGAGFNSLGRVHGDTMGNVAHSPYATQTPPPNAGAGMPTARPSATPNSREPRDAVNPRVPTAYGGSLARGGQVPPLGAPHQDSVQIAATPNEFVVRQSAAQQIGDPGLNRLNQFDHLPPGVQQMIKQALRR